MEEFPKNFESKVLKKDFTEVSQEVQQRVEKSAETGVVSDREAISEALKPRVYPAPQNQTQQADEDKLPDYIKEASPEVRQKVEGLLTTVFRDGLDKAVKKLKSEPPFVVDAFHDALVDAFYEELKKRKMVQ